MRETVVERQDDERSERRRDGDSREGLFDVGRVVAVGQHDTLRIGRGAGGVGDGGEILVAQVAADGQERFAVLRQVFAPYPLERFKRQLAPFQRSVAHHDDMPQFGQLFAQASDFG